MRIVETVRLLRVHQWTKNLICFAGVIFGGKFLDLEAWLMGSLAFFFFSITSSSIYVFNDIIDREKDAIHPKKKNRPIANGKISVANGVFVGVLLLGVGLIGGYLTGFSLFLLLLLYVVNNIAYSLVLKSIPLLDVFSISVGFVLRLFAGIYLLGDMPTAWIVLCTMFLALFLGFSKRRAEFIMVGNMSYTEVVQRPVLRRYDGKTLDSLVNESSLGAVLTYALFTTTSGKNPTLILTVPVIYYALMHYKRLLFNNKHGEEPARVLLQDKNLWYSIILWLILYGVITYYNINIFS